MRGAWSLEADENMDEIDLLQVRRAHDALTPMLSRAMLVASGVVDERDLATCRIFETLRDMLDPRSPSTSAGWKISEGIRRALQIPDGSLPRTQLLLHPRWLYSRDMTAGVASAGGYAVGVGVTEVLAARQPVDVLARLGVVYLPGMVGDGSIARFTSAPTMTWLSTEATPVTESTPEIGAEPLMPKTGGVHVEVSRQAVLQVSPAGEAQFKADARNAVRIGNEAAALNGSGAAGQPLGVCRFPGIGTATGASLGYAGIVAAQLAIANGNGIVDVGSLGAVCHPDVAALMLQRARFSNTDTPLWVGNIAQGELCGMRAFSTRNMPAGSLLIGDFSQLVIPIWGVIALEMNPFADFPAGIIGLRVLATIDVAIRWPGSFFAITGIT